MQNLKLLGKNINCNNTNNFGRNVTIYNNVIIEEDVFIGDNCQIGYYEKETNDITVIKSGSRIRSGAIIYYGCVIGNNSIIGHNTILRDKTIVGNNTVIGSFVMCEGNSNIGSNVLINEKSHITRYCDIGDYTFFGSNVITTNDTNIAYKREEHGLNLKGLTTGKYVRVASGVMFKPNITLGDGCIIGLGSIVTKDVEAYTLVTGSPARFVQKLDKNEDNCIINKE